MTAGHFDLLCPVCRRRVGGCRCMSPGKEQRLAAAPCPECAASAAGVGQQFPTVGAGESLVISGVLTEDADGRPRWTEGRVRVEPAPPPPGTMAAAFADFAEAVRALGRAFLAALDPLLRLLLSLSRRVERFRRGAEGRTPPRPRLAGRRPLTRRRQ